MSKLNPSYKLTPLTLNFLDELAAKNAPPKAIASSPFICVPIFYFGAFNILAIIDCSFGILDPPPINYIECNSSALISFSRRNLFNGEVNSSNTYSALFSNSALVIFEWKSIPSMIPSTNMLAYLLALNVSFTLLDSASNFINPLLSSFFLYFCSNIYSKYLHMMLSILNPPT